MDDKLITSCNSTFKTFVYMSNQRRLDPGMDTPRGFFKVGNQKKYQKMVITTFVHLEK